MPSLQSSNDETRAPAWLVPPRTSRAGGPNHFHRLAFALGDLAFLVFATAAAAWAMSLGHRPARDLLAGALLGR